MSALLRYGARASDVTVLGPGKRCVLWVFGCCFSCEGCIGEHYKTGSWLETSAREMAEWYLSHPADGLTISGGEPMLQAGALCEMIDRIRAVRPCGVIVYTGFTLEMLQDESEDVRRLLEHIDLLIDGPYIRELDHNQSGRGSENQRIIPLTPLYQQEAKTYYAPHVRHTEIRMSREGTLMIGVPDREQAEVWRKIKTLGGESCG